MTLQRASLALLIALTTQWSAQADPCGMVPPPPPIDLSGPPIERIGLQKTYVFFKDGVETIAIRPGFRGQVDEFGMLIPFPTPPEIRKLPDSIFAHLDAAIDPPAIRVRVDDPDQMRVFAMADMAPTASRAMESEGELTVDTVRVLREEAVGMYEVAVLAAGSAAALSRWMADHGYQYPIGMDVVCEDYVAAGWCFVAVKTKVGQKSAVQPQPGMREADATLPAGSSFDGNVQAMGFRFQVDELVVPMRLSAFNEGSLRNVIYLLAEDGLMLDGAGTGVVRRQISGQELYDNLTRLLPVETFGSASGDVLVRELAKIWDSLRDQRDPTLHNGFAKDLFAGDLYAARSGQLSLDHEELEKELLRIGERLGLRGPELDALHQQVLQARLDAIATEALESLKDMTLTVIDGELDRELIANDNLHFSAYDLPGKHNTAAEYHAPSHDARGVSAGPVWTGDVRPLSLVVNSRGQRIAVEPPSGSNLLALGLLGVLALGMGWSLFLRRLARRNLSKAAAGLLVILGMGLTLETQAQDGPDLPTLLAALAGEEPEQAVDSLVARGAAAVPGLVEASDDESASLTHRGWAVVALAEIGDPQAREGLFALRRANAPLVQVWAAAGELRTAPAPELDALAAELVAARTVLLRPATLRLDAEGLSRPKLATALLERAGQMGPWQQDAALNRAIADLGAETLVEVLLRGETVSAQIAAGQYLGALSQQRPGENERIVSQFLNALRADPDASEAPWSRNALYLPQISWTPEDHERLLHELSAWIVWADGKGDEHRIGQLLNNLDQLSWQLGRPLERRTEGARGWLEAYGQSRGSAALTRVLAEQGALDRYADLLRALEGN